MPQHGQVNRFRVVVVGGGVAALEAVLALQHLGPERFSVTVITSAAEFVVRPMTVAEPFAYPPAHRYPLAPVLTDLGATYVPENLASVDVERCAVTTAAGQVVEYDALLVACGARPSVRFEHAVTIDDRKLDDLLHGMVQDIEGDYIHSVAFVAPERMSWPVPLYDLALLTAHRAWSMGLDLTTTLVTPEDRPLALFGGVASQGVADLLRSANIQVMTSAHAEVPHRRQIVINPGERQLQVDRVVALPELFGPAIPGLPQDDLGFVPVDDYGRVPGAGPIFAAGDVTNYPIKHGGIAAQMADTAARGIAVLAGLSVRATPLDPVLRAMLLTGDGPRYLSAHRTGGHAFDSTFSDTPPEAVPHKLSARYLSAYLDARDQAASSTPVHP